MLLGNYKTPSSRHTEYFANRLFIAAEIAEAGILGSWAGATRDVTNDHDLDKFAERFTEINKKIVHLATGS